VTACVKCGHDPAATIAASWSFVIEREVVSLNERSTNRGAWRTRRAYKADRKAWAWHLRDQRLKLQIPAARAKRRITLTRIYGPGCRAFDRDNLAGGLKLVVDDIVKEGLLLGDRPKDAEIHYEQRRVAAGEVAGLRVVIEELAGQTPAGRQVER